jgi:formyl-CoA transferase
LNCVGHPVTFVGEMRDPGLPPPTLGQHTDDVLTELGLSAGSIAELRREEIVS